ncbi:MAG: hypothetical protein IJE00_07335 [Clostridia bacterium]|nr:hypothetical protein [Clostridia bacterium]
MKKTTKLFAALMAVMMLLSLMPLSALAAPRVIEAEAALPTVYLSAADNGNYDSLGLTAEQLDQLQKELTDAGKEWEASLDVSAYNIPMTDENVLLIRDLFAQDCPELFHAWFSYTYMSVGDVKMLYQIKFNYDTAGYTYEQYAEIRAQYEAVAKAMTADLDGLTDLQKALLLHDRLAVHCEYDQERLEDGELTNAFDASFSMVGALVNRKAVCQGYAEAYSYLLSLVGVEDYLCASAVLNHVWNIVIIDGVKYHVDVTWDDPTWDRTGRVRHNNFLLSSEAIYASGHRAYDYDISPNDYSYDYGSVWLSSDSEFQYIDGQFYYIDNRNKTLNRWDGGSTSWELESVDDHWAASATSSWTGNFSALSSWMGTLYYSLADGIYSYDPSTDSSVQVYAADLTGGDYYSVYGFVAENNQFIYNAYSTPNFERGTKSATLHTHTFREASVGILGSSLTLGDLLDTQLAVEIPSDHDVTELQLAVTADGVTQYLPIPNNGIDTVYTVTMSTAAKDMTAEYTLQVVDADKQAVGASRTTSIRQYAETLLTGNYSDSVKAVAKAMLNYGAAAQVYFETRIDDLANADYELDLTAVDVSGIADTVKENSLPSYLGCSLILKSETHIRLYFTEAVTDAQQTGNRYYLSIDGIGADDLNTVYTVEVDGATYRLSALSLAKTVIEGEYSEDFKDLMRTLVLYADAVQTL